MVPKQFSAQPERSAQMSISNADPSLESQQDINDHPSSAPLTPRGPISQAVLRIRGGEGHHCCAECCCFLCICCGIEELLCIEALDDCFGMCCWMCPHTIIALCSQSHRCFLLHIVSFDLLASYTSNFTSQLDFGIPPIDLSRCDWANSVNPPLITLQAVTAQLRRSPFSLDARPFTGNSKLNPQPFIQSLKDSHRLGYVEMIITLVPTLIPSG